jgi:predicted esterase YcpF (UPF0227 family)
MKTLIVYFHGYGSNADSSKVNQLRSAGFDVSSWDIDIDPDISIPYLEDKIIDLLLNNLNADINLIFIGTSLGAWYAAKLGDSFYAPPILINPCYDPTNILSRHQLPKELLEKYHPIKFTNEHAVYLGDNDEIIDYSGVDFGNAVVHRIEGADHRFNEHFSLVIDALR